MKQWLNKILDSNDTKSSKRFITLLIALHFIIASFVALFFAFYVIVYLPKGRVEPELIDILEKILEYDFFIILGGLGFVTSEGLIKIIMNKSLPNQNPSQIDQEV